MKILSSIFDVTEKFDGFVIDLWGVIHDGAELYPGVIPVLEKLRSKNKKIIFLSNAPRRQQVAADKLTKLGIDKKLYDTVVTSGEVAFESLKANKDFPDTYYYIGPERDIGLADGLRYKRVDKPKDAGFIIATGFDHDDSPEDEKLAELHECAKYKIPMICSNPDIIIVRRNGQRAWCSGVIAKQYEGLGGKVLYFGKPYPDVYKKCFEVLNMDKKKIAAIGDNPDTDIKGANNAGIYSVLVTGGILAEELGIKPGDAPNPAQIKQACSKYGIFADAYISNFK